MMQGQRRRAKEVSDSDGVGSQGGQGVDSRGVGSVSGDGGGSQSGDSESGVSECGGSEGPGSEGVVGQAARSGTTSHLRVELDTALGYLLKQVAAALRGEMDAVLRPLGLTVAQYACLELLAQRPGLSNSDLARGVFVSRQAMNTVLQGLERAGLVRRVDAPGAGRSRPGRLTSPGRRLLARASAAVAEVQARMGSTLVPDEQYELRRLLRACLRGLSIPE